MDKKEKVWLDGRLIGIDEAKVSILSYGLHYGWGIYEGLRAYDTNKGRAVFRLKDHMARFLDSARFMQLDVPYSIDELCDAVKEVCRSNGPQADYVRPLAYYGENGELGLSAVNVPTHVAIMTIHMGAYIRGGAPGASLVTSSWEKPSNRATSLTAKVCGNYVNSILAKKEAMRQGADEALMLNHSGSVAEASAENVFMVRHGKIITPGLAEGILEGVTRDTVMQLARELDIEVVERNITRGELIIADEVFLTGTAAELHPVRSLDGIPIGKDVPGPVTARLRDMYAKATCGEMTQFSDWVDLIDEKPARRRKK
ncbi:MAG: branched-chain amino acid transaminase [Methanomassiliicoccus sp.]|nr:branched-chain amino acid transaminase [Methanomassiliicoccus sp.]